MAIQYAPLFALETQFQTKDGRNNTGGWLKVFLAATDDPATTYSDYNGTHNPEKIVLDDDGRAIVICDKSKAYRLEVYDVNGMLLWTEEPVYCSGTGGGGVSITKVISTNGSISIDESVVGSTTTYDIGIAPSDSDEFLEWIKCSEEDCGSTWYPVFQDGTMETEAGQGIKVHKDHLYHFTNSFTIDPDGTGINYDTFSVLMYCGDEIVETRRFDIDSSLHDPVLCEFSHDLIPADDSHVYFKLVIPATCEVAGEVQVHRIYSGINAVPDTCATKQWVSGNYQPLSGMSSYVPYSAMDHNIVGQVTGINGSAIVGSLDFATVSSIASSVASAYTESAISSKADASSLTAYQTVSAMSAYATESYVDSAVSGKLDVTASSMFITSLPADLATTGDVASAVSGKMDSSASSSFYPMTGNPSGFLTAHQSLAGLATEAYVDSAVSGKLDTSAYDSAQFQQASAMSSWIPYSALDYSGTAISGIGGSSLAGMGGGGGDYTGIYPVNVDNTARKISVDSLPLVTDSSLTAYGSAGSSVIGVNMDILSGKQDTSAMTAYQLSGDYYSATNPSGFITGVDLTPYQLTADMSAYQPSGDYAYNSSVSSKLDASASSEFYSTSNPSGFITGVDLTNYATTGYVNSSVSGKLDSSASSDFYSTSNPSGFITGIDLSPYQLTADMSGYYTTANESGYVNSAYVEGQVSGKQDITGMSAYQLSGDYYSASNPSGFITGVDLSEYATTGYVDSAVSGKQDASAMTAYQLSGDYAYNSALADYQPVTGMSAYQPSGDYAANSALSSKLDASASALFQPSGDYAFNSALTAYQPVSGMTAYQPAGTYIYESALGWAEV